MPLPAKLWNRPQDGISWIQKVATVELGFWLLVLIVWGYVDIYMGAQRFHSVWTPFDILFLRNTEIGKKNNNSGLGLQLIG